MGNNKYFTELTRVQIPAILHLTRIGYTYYGKINEDMAGTVYDPDTNILLDVFIKQFDVLNPEHAGGAMETISQIRQELDNDDLGRSFYKRLTSVSPVRLIDFDNPENYKQLDAMDVEFYPHGDYNVTASIELDDEGWQEIGTLNMAGGGVTLPVDLPFTLTSAGVARTTFHLQEYGEFKKIKVKFVQDGLSELCQLHSYTIFARIKPWRRE